MNNNIEHLIGKPVKSVYIAETKEVLNLQGFIVSAVDSRGKVKISDRNKGVVFGNPATQSDLWFDLSQVQVCTIEDFRWTPKKGERI